MRFTLVAFLFVFLSHFAYSKVPELRIARLECDYMINPIAVENIQPKLSWHLLSDFKAKRQKAYRVLVASSSTLLEQDRGDFWDSGKVNSNQSTELIYQGKALSSRRKVFWKVMVWDEKNESSVWSETAYWSMGLLKATDWQAKWIGASNNFSPYFRKEFFLSKVVKQAIVHVSGLGFYELSLNGKKIGSQVLAPAVTNYDVRPLRNLLYPYDDQSEQRVLYNTFDVSDQLKQKRNVIDMQLGNGWYNQRDRRVEGDMWYGDPKLIFQLEIQYLDGSKQTIVSDPSWKTNKGALLSNGIFTGEKYDARLEFSGWKEAGFPDHDWENALMVTAPTGALHAQHAPFDHIVRTLEPRFDSVSADGIYHYHLNETVSGWAAIELQGKAGAKVQIRYLTEEGEDYGQADTYVLKGSGVENWEPKFTWHAFRRIEISSPDVKLNEGSVKIRDVHTQVQQDGTFECGNEFFNTINKAYIRTQNANFHGSVSSDCPHRERLGYTGDGQVVVESSIYSYDMRNFYRKWFRDMKDASNKKTGYVPHTAPFGGGGGGPAWGSAYVIMPWVHYSFYNDLNVLTEHYAGMKKWLAYLQTRTNKDGLIEREEPGGWCLGDWCTPGNVDIPEQFVNTAYYYHVTDILKKVAKALGKTEDWQQFHELAKRISFDFNRAYYDDSKGRYWEGKQGADAFALAFGLVPQTQHQRVFDSLLLHLKNLNYHFDTGILGTPLLLKVLSDNGRDDIAFRLMDQKDFPGFGYLLDSKNSTLWETWDGQGSKSHPMFGSVVSWFYSGLAGIKAVGQNIVIKPGLIKGLSFCRASYESTNGRIRSEWKKDANGSYDLLIEIPVNCSATLVLPGKGNAEVFESGIYEIKGIVLN